MSSEISVPQGIKVKTDIGTVEVKKVPLGRYTELVGWMKRFIPKVRNDYGDIFGEGVDIELTPELLLEWIEKYIDDVIDFINIGTGLAAEDIRDNIGGMEAYELCKAIADANKIGELLKKVFAPEKQINEAQAEGQ